MLHRAWENLSKCYKISEGTNEMSTLALKCQHALSFTFQYCSNFLLT